MLLGALLREGGVNKVFFFRGSGEEALCEIEELEGGGFRVLQVCEGDPNLKVRCHVCGGWNLITRVKFVNLDGWDFVPICSEECYLAFNLKGRRNK